MKNNMKKILCLLIAASLLLCGCSAPDEELFPKALEELSLLRTAKIDLDIRGRAVIEGDGFPQVSNFSAKADLKFSDGHCSGTMTMDMDGIRLNMPLYLEYTENTSSIYISLNGGIWLKSNEVLDTDSTSLPSTLDATLIGSETVGEAKKYLFDIIIPGDAFALENIWDVVDKTQSSELFDMDAAELPPLSDMKATLWVDSESGSVSRLRVDLTDSMEDLSSLLLTKTLESEAEGSGVDVPKADITVEELIMDIYISEIGTAQAEPIPNEVREKAIDMDAIGEERSDALISAYTYLMSLDLSFEGLKMLLELDEYTEEDIAFALENCNADWDVEAIDFARHTLSSGGFSEKSLREQMELEQFEKELIDKAIESVKPDWDKEAADFVAYNIHNSSVSRGLLEKAMLEMGFTEEQTIKALDNSGADWDAEAKAFVDELMEYGGYSEALLRNTLTEMLFDESQIENAIAADIDWREQSVLYAIQLAEEKIGLSGSQMKYLITEYGLFSQELAEYAIENSGIDWNLQAEHAARTYLLEAPYSYQRMINLLQEDGFSYNQAVFGADSCGADWYAETIRAIHAFEDEMGARLMQYGPSSAWVTLSLNLQRALYPLDLIRPALAECGYYN